MKVPDACVGNEGGASVPHPPLPRNAPATDFLRRTFCLKRQPAPIRPEQLGRELLLLHCVTLTVRHCFLHISVCYLRMWGVSGIGICFFFFFEGTSTGAASCGRLADVRVVLGGAAACLSAAKEMLSDPVSSLKLFVCFFAGLRAATRASW